MANINADFISGVDIITQVGMLEPVIESAASITGVFREDIEVVGSFARKTYVSDKKPCIDLMIPVDNQKSAKNLLNHFSTIPGPSRNKGFMIEIEIGWGWIGIIPAIHTNIKNYYYFVDYQKGNCFLTNPIIHVNYIKNLHLGGLIRVLKKDLINEEIEINSFALEVLVATAVKGFLSATEDESYLKVLEYMAQKFSNANLLDPSNSDNIISREIKTYTRERLRIFAVKALKNLL